MLYLPRAKASIGAGDKPRRPAISQERTRRARPGRTPREELQARQSEPRWERSTCDWAVSCEAAGWRPYKADPVSRCERSEAIRFFNTMNLDCFPRTAGAGAGRPASRPHVITEPLRRRHALDQQHRELGVFVADLARLLVFGRSIPS